MKTFGIRKRRAELFYFYGISKFNFGLLQYYSLFVRYRWNSILKISASNNIIKKKKKLTYFNFLSMIRLHIPKT